MLTRDDLVLCAGTLRQCDFRGLVEAAAAAGFSGISVQPHLYEGARASGLCDADLRHLLEDHGLEIAELDALLRWLPLSDDHPAARMARHGADDFFRIADGIGGRSLNVAQILPTGVSIDAAAEALAPVCEGAARCDLRVSLEFLPWTDIPDPATALAIVERTGHANAGIMVDSWHVYRGVGDVAAVRAIPGERIVGVQLNDAPETSAIPNSPPMTETLDARLIPGDGDIDLVGLVEALDAVGSTAPIGVEVYSTVLAGQDANEVARRTGEATRALLERARR